MESHAQGDGPLNDRGALDPGATAVPAGPGEIERSVRADLDAFGALASGISGSLVAMTVALARMMDQVVQTGGSPAMLANLNKQVRGNLVEIERTVRDAREREEEAAVLSALNGNAPPS
jgi:hypothetical protein